jgi:CubicO group peptidase (beta-lactamase class C family)
MKVLKFLLAALLLISSTVAAESTSAPRHAEQAFDAWLAAHNAGDRHSLESFDERYKVKADVQYDLDFRESVGRLQLLEVTKSTPTTVEALVLSEWGKAMLARIAIDPRDRFKLSKMEFEGVPTPEAFMPKPLEPKALVAEVKGRLDSLAAAGQLSGSFLLASKDQPDFEWVGGMADREKSIPVSATTRFRMASLGKMITAVAILQLTEAGRISLDGRLAQYLPSYPNHAVASAITLRQLLNHTSGTGDVFGDEFNKISGSLKTHQDYWGPFASKALEFKPGTQDRYSNYGYILLGSVIEAASGQSYYDYIDQHIYGPAGMTSTGSAPESELVPDRAYAYTKTDGKWTRETASLPWRGTAAGGSYTTARDLMKFVVALNNGKLISAESLRAATQPQNNKAWYGYGFMVSGKGVRRQFGHEGGAAGENAALIVVPAAGYVIVGLSNFDPSTMGNMVNFASQRLPQAVPTAAD